MAENNWQYNSALIKASYPIPIFSSLLKPKPPIARLSFWPKPRYSQVTVFYCSKSNTTSWYELVCCIDSLSVNFHFSCSYRPALNVASINNWRVQAKWSQPHKECHLELTRSSLLCTYVSPFYNLSRLFKSNSYPKENSRSAYPEQMFAEKSSSMICELAENGDTVHLSKYHSENSCPIFEVRYDLTWRAYHNVRPFQCHLP